MSEGSDMAHWDIKRELCNIEGGQSARNGRTVLDADAQAEGNVSAKLSTFHGPRLGRVTRKGRMPLFVRV